MDKKEVEMLSKTAEKKRSLAKGLGSNKKVVEPNPPTNPKLITGSPPSGENRGDGNEVTSQLNVSGVSFTFTDFRNITNAPFETDEEHPVDGNMPPDTLPGFPQPFLGGIFPPTLNQHVMVTPSTSTMPPVPQSHNEQNHSEPRPGPSAMVVPPIANIFSPFLNSNSKIDSKKVYTTSFNDLPLELLPTILKFIDSDEDRNNCRLVSTVWKHCINLYCSSETYDLSPAKKRFNFKFSSLIPEFLNYYRRNISFFFSEMNLEKTEEYWNIRGNCVLNIIFENCRSIPLRNIVKFCNLLKKIKIVIQNNNNELDSLKLHMEQCVQEGISNTSVRQISFAYIESDDMVQLIHNISKIFPFLSKMKWTVGRMYRLSEISAVYKSLPKINFNIFLKNIREDENPNVSKILFESSSEPSILDLFVDYSEDYSQEIEFLVSSFKYKHLRSLIFRSAQIVSFLDFEKIISKSDMETLEVIAPQILAIGTSSFTNFLTTLVLLLPFPLNPISCIQIGHEFTCSYKNLVVLTLFAVRISSYITIIKNLKMLKKMEISAIVPEFEVYPNATLENESLKILSIPRALFVFTSTKLAHSLINLEILVLTNENSNCDVFEAVYDECNRNINQNDFRNFDCPLVRFIDISLVNWCDQNNLEMYNWIRGILITFPNIVDLMLRHSNFTDDSLPITNNELVSLLTSNPKLEFISGVQNISNRIAELRSL